MKMKTESESECKSAAEDSDHATTHEPSRGIQMEVVADVYQHQQQTQQQSQEHTQQQTLQQSQQQTQQQSQRNIQSTQTRPSNAERQRRYRERRKADKMNACTTFSQSDNVQPQHDDQMNKLQPLSNAERQRKYRKLLREQQQQQQQMEVINAITVLSNKPHTSRIDQLQNVDHAVHARKRHLNKQRQSRFRARQRLESRSTSSHQARAERPRSPPPAGSAGCWGELWGSCDPFDVTPAKTICKTDTPEPPCVDASQWTEGTDLPRDQAEGIVARTQRQVQWAPFEDNPPSHVMGTQRDEGIVIKVELEEYESSSEGRSSPEAAAPDSTAVPPLPGVRGESRTTGRPVARDGSDIDSDYNDEFDFKSVEMVERDIPDDEQLEEPIRVLINEAQTAMDDEIDRLGVSRDFVWSDDFETFNGKREEFSGPSPGAVRDYDTPYDAFIDIWSSDIMGLIVEETNRFAKQSIDDRTAKGTVKPTSRVSKWRDTDPDELYTLLAVVMCMGIDKRESQSEYWRLTGCLEMPQFKQLMTSNRYILLNKFLHFVDDRDANRTQSERATPGRLRKLAPVISHLNSKFSSLYNLEQNVSVDESLTLLNGRTPWAQAIRTKSARFGIRSCEVCESVTGYMHKFDIYVGNNCGGSLSSDLGCKSVKMLLELLKGLYNRGHCVTMDNFYNSPALARFLKSVGTDCSGAVRASRKHVPHIVPNNVEKGTIVARHSGDVSVISWRDVRIMTMISTLNESIGKKAAESDKPSCFKSYSSSMRALDIKNKKLSAYLSERRGSKWYTKLFKRLLNVSVHNAFVTLRSSLSRRGLACGREREFRYELADAIARRHRRGPELAPQLGQAVRLRRDVVHRPRAQSGRNNRKRCYVCYRLGTYKLVHSQCVTCDEFVCFERCWEEWHSLPALREDRSRKRGRRGH